MEKIRQTNIDAMRVLAAIAVVFIHAASFSDGAVFALFNAATRFSVPVFFMISGYFMLDKNYSFIEILKKSFKLFILMLFWSCTYLVFDIINKNFHYEGVHETIKVVLGGPVHFWYFYAAIILYLFTPLFAAFCKTAERKTYVYVLCLMFFFGCIIFVLLSSPWSKHFPILLMLTQKSKFGAQTGFLFCYLFGHYIKRFGTDKKSRIILYILALCGMAVTFFASFGNTRDTAISFYSPAVMITACAVFTAFAQSRHKFKTAALAHCTKGVFIIHILLLNYVNRIYTYLSFPDGFFQVVSVGTVTSVLSFATVFLLKKIPIIRNII